MKVNFSSRRFWYMLATAALALQLSAQVPESVMLFKVIGGEQTSASGQQISEPGYGVVVTFPAPVPVSTVVRLVGPVTVGLERDDAFSYSTLRTFINEASLHSALPVGTYSLVTSGGGEPSSTPIGLASLGNFRPSLFTNFDALQAWTDDQVRFTWEPIAGGTAMDALQLEVARMDGTVVYSSPPYGQRAALTGLSQALDVSGLPRDEPLRAQLTYLRFTFGFANNGATITLSGGGFVLDAPLRLVSSRPAIGWQPRSQNVAAGSTVAFGVGATGTTLNYQWRRNGAPLPGATNPTLIVTNAAPSHAGVYTVVVTNTAGSVTSDPVTLTVASGVLPGRISNLAIRSQAGSDARTLIVGFAIGPAGASGSKPVLVRGIGPTLGVFGVPGVLGDPKLEVFRGTTKIGENDDWNGSSVVSGVADSVGAFPLSAAASKDAALYNAAFASGTYSVQLTGPPGATGVALAEIYDAATSYGASSSRLVNVSARTEVGSGADILIAGFVISGDAAKTLLIRAIGPTLSGFGVAGALADPKLELYSGRTKLSENDDWGGGAALGNVFLNAGAFPLLPASRDSTLLVTLPPGNYTAQVSGVGNTTGIALVEIYEVP
jgi:hypothetical protein